jgi:hypothetical protein
MPLWAWFLVGVVVLVPMWVHDRRAKARGSRLNDPGSTARGAEISAGSRPPISTVSR